MNINKRYTEQELIVLLADGNEGAFEQLFRLHHHRISAFVSYMVEQEPVAEDLIQEIFLKLWSNRRKLPAVSNFSAYLYTMARNHIYSYLKKQGRELREKEQLGSYSFVVQETEEEFNYRKLIEEAINLLPAQQRKAYLLSRDAGLSNLNIAKEMGISLETVKKHIVLALRNIRNHLMISKDRVVYFFVFSFQFHYLF